MATEPALPCALGAAGAAAGAAAAGHSLSAISTLAILPKLKLANSLYVKGSELRAENVNIHFMSVIGLYFVVNPL